MPSIRLPVALPAALRVASLPIAAAALALAAPRPSTGQGPARRPVAPLVVPNSCTYECCPLGRWRVRAPVAAHVAPGERARVRFRVRPGAIVTADSSVVRVDTLGVVVMRAPYAEGGGAPRFAAGDTVLVLHYGGEGIAEVWHRGARHQVYVFWLADDPAEASRLPGHLVRAPSAAWWARVRDARGQIGWIAPDARVVVPGLNCAV